MQDQLDELRKLKVLRLSRMERQETFYGLLDSGATHPMRSAKKGEDLSTCETVQVTLANGHQVEMKMTSKGIMVVEDTSVKPIVPMSMLAGELGYTITWKEGVMKVEHPKRDWLSADLQEESAAMDEEYED